MPHPRLTTLLLAGVIATGSSLAVTLPSDAAVYGVYQLQSHVSGKCLQPVNGSQGAAIVQETCNGSVAQQWTQETSASNSNADWYVNRSSGLCLDARGGPTDGTPVEQWTCDRISNENWSDSVYNTDSNYNLVSEVSSGPGRDSISTPGPANGDAMVLYSNDGATSEAFSLIQA
jgi:hypothetical protein